MLSGFCSFIFLQQIQFSIYTSLRHLAMHHGQCLYDFWHTHINSTPTKPWTNYHSHIYELSWTAKLSNCSQINQHAGVIQSYYLAQSRAGEMMWWCVACDEMITAGVPRGDQGAEADDAWSLPWPGNGLSSPARRVPAPEDTGLLAAQTSCHSPHHQHAAASGHFLSKHDLDYRCHGLYHIGKKIQLSNHNHTVWFERGESFWWRFLCWDNLKNCWFHAALMWKYLLTVSNYFDWFWSLEECMIRAQPIIKLVTL